MLPWTADLGERMRIGLGDLSIAQKLPAAIVGSALLVSAAVGLAGYLIGASAVASLTQERQEAVAIERAQKVQLYLDGLAEDVIQLSSSPQVPLRARIAWRPKPTCAPCPTR